MGWTWYNAQNYKNGKVDRKAEMDEQFNRDGYKVLKSCMKGNTWYGAVEYFRNEKRIVFGCVCLTRTNMKDYYNFGYKDMDETMNPYYYDCPKSIIDLLTPTDNEWANEWRKKCLDVKEETTIQKLNKLPIGTKIQWTRYDGSVASYYKHNAGYQFKKPFWMNCDAYNYISAKHIPDSFVVVSF